MMKTHVGSEAHTRYIDAELLAKKKEKQLHIIYNMLVITRKERTEMSSSHFFAVLISYANSTILTRQLQ